MGGSAPLLRNPPDTTSNSIYLLSAVIFIWSVGDVLDLLGAGYLLLLGGSVGRFHGTRGTFGVQVRSRATIYEV